MKQGSDNKIKYGIGYMNNYSTIESNETFSARKMIDFDIFIPYDKSNVSFLLLDKYPQIMYCFIDLNLDKTTYKTLTFEISQTIFHFENIALEDGTFIFCYSEDTTNKDIYCGTMSFLSGQMNIDNSPVLIISNSEIGDAYFSMYKLGINRVVLGVGKQNLYFAIIDKSMQFSASPIKIINNDMDYSNMNFCSLSDSQLILIGSYLNQELGYFTYHYSKVNFIFEDIYDENTIESLDNVISNFLNQDLKYQLCSEGCYSCILKSNSEHCVKCKNNINYYERRDLTSTCIKRESNPDAYYFNSTEKAFIKCSAYWYRKKEDNNVICYDECPSSLYIYTNSKECVDQCEKVSYQGECIDNCPSDMITNSKNECIEGITAEKGVDVISAPFSKEEIIEHIEIESFTEEGITILGSDYTVQVYPTSNQINESNDI